MEQPASVLGPKMTRRQLNSGLSVVGVACLFLFSGWLGMKLGPGESDDDNRISVGASTILEIETERLVCAVALRGNRVEAMGCVRKNDDEQAVRVEAR